MSTKRWITLIVLVAVIGAYWLLRPRRAPLAEAYVAERSATIWDTTAQVRQELATLKYGEKVVVLERRGGQARIRSANGVTGWMDSRFMMEPELWKRGAQLLVQTRSLPVQATGRTKVPTNVRAEPGRSGARLYQFNRDSPVEIFARQAAEVPAEESAAKDNGDRTAQAEEKKPRREDWVLIRGSASPAPAISPSTGVPINGGGEPIEIARWSLARFIELTLPEPVRDYASSSGMRVFAWFELNRVTDSDGNKPQYLAVGARGGEGQACDFTLLRVYTWGSKRRRYETAFVESEFCGYLPVRAGTAPNGDPEFRFTALGKQGREERLYRMRQTVVRRVRESERPPLKKK